MLSKKTYQITSSFALLLSLMSSAYAMDKDEDFNRARGDEYCARVSEIPESVGSTSTPTPSLVGEEKEIVTITETPKPKLPILFAEKDKPITFKLWELKAAAMEEQPRAGRLSAYLSVHFPSLCANEGEISIPLSLLKPEDLDTTLSEEPSKVIAHGFKKKLDLAMNGKVTRGNTFDAIKEASKILDIDFKPYATYEEGAKILKRLFPNLLAHTKKAEETSKTTIADKESCIDELNKKIYQFGYDKSVVENSLQTVRDEQERLKRSAAKDVEELKVAAKAEEDRLKAAAKAEADRLKVEGAAIAEKLRLFELDTATKLSQAQAEKDRLTKEAAENLKKVVDEKDSLTLRLDIVTSTFREAYKKAGL